MVAILGGTFDPVHYGHLRIALEAGEALGLDAVRFIPSRQPPHRTEPGATPEQRLDLLRRATADDPRFVIDIRELDRPGPSYMVDTLASLRQELGATPLCLILGRDAFLGLPRWHRWRELLDYAHLLVMARFGEETMPAGELEAFSRSRRCPPEVLHGTPSGGIAFLESTRLDVSASRIRALLRTGRDPRYLLPDAVLERIRELDLYLS